MRTSRGGDETWLRVASVAQDDGGASGLCTRNELHSRFARAGGLETRPRVWSLTGPCFAQSAARDLHVRSSTKDQTRIHGRSDRQ